MFWACRSMANRASAGIRQAGFDRLTPNGRGVAKTNLGQLTEADKARFPLALSLSKGAPS